MKKQHWLIFTLVIFLTTCYGKTQDASPAIPDHLVIMDPGRDTNDCFKLVTFDLSTGEEKCRFMIDGPLGESSLFYVEKFKHFFLLQFPSESNKTSSLYFLNAKDCSRFSLLNASGFPTSYRINLLKVAFETEMFFVSRDRQHLHIAFAGEPPAIPPKWMKIDIETGKTVGSFDLKWPLQSLVCLRNGVSALGLIQGNWFYRKKPKISLWDGKPTLRFKESQSENGTGAMIFIDLTQPDLSGEVALNANGNLDLLVAPDEHTAYVIDDGMNAKNSRVHMVSIDQKKLLGVEDIGWSPLRDDQNKLKWLMTANRLVIACHGEPRTDDNQEQLPEQSMGRLYIFSGPGEKSSLDLGIGTSLLEWGRDENEVFVGWNGHLAIVDLNAAKIKSVISGFGGRMPEMPSIPDKVIILHDKRLALISFLNESVVAVVDLQEAKIVSKIKTNLATDSRIHSIAIDLDDESQAYAITNGGDYGERMLYVIDLKTYSIKGSHSIGSNLLTWKKGSERLFFSGGLNQLNAYTFKPLQGDKIEFTQHPTIAGLSYVDYIPSINCFLGLTKKWELMLVDESTGTEMKRVKLIPQRPKPVMSYIYQSTSFNMVHQTLITKPFEFFLIKNSQ